MTLLVLLLRCSAVFTSTNTATATTPSLLSMQYTFFSRSLSCASGLSSPTLSHVPWSLTSVLNCILLFLWFPRSPQSSISVLHHVASYTTYSTVYSASVILKLHSSFYAFTISQCLYVGPDSAYITLDTRNSSLCWILFCRLGRQFYQL